MVSSLRSGLDAVKRKVDEPFVTILQDFMVAESIFEKPEAKLTRDKDHLTTAADAAGAAAATSAAATGAE
eukprot:11218353-Lingulodinium_polyedra.AAC.1